ncbi:conserved hypothetical protein [Formosa agariphila KMM 3901]|uniref:Dihydrolipoamide dehydrogenase n=1 Tax=Formosa agariphila (strain DSM 15362 / KCTC 12365 / LMG 23005 / KMM 3901 / M-2Alg 35-1) TaxID=1347342 RepID=T2KGC7_FORAG|nr:hypothetical protein [Formosa agariphila]CDF77812.1 conserved hypothetical protein [Formosa agariphila KMM 3901]
MKHIIALFCLALVFTACEGDQGPTGPPGQDGLDGEVGAAFEIEVDFNAANNYTISQFYGFDIVPSDAVLVYISWETIDGQEYWRLVPQTHYFENGGILTYNYDFTDEDFAIFLTSPNVDLNTLDNEFTQNQLFRVVIVPADYIGGVDTSNLDAVIEASKIESFESLETM